MKIKYHKCGSCKKKFRVVELWRNNHILASGTKFLCELCFAEKTAKNAHHLLQRYNKAMENLANKQSYSFFEQTYDRSTRNEQVIFLGLLQEGHGGEHATV